MIIMRPHSRLRTKLKPQEGIPTVRTRDDICSKDQRVVQRGIHVEEVNGVRVDRDVIFCGVHGFHDYERTAESLKQFLRGEPFFKLR